MKPRKAIQALILLLVFSTGVLVLSSSSNNSDKPDESAKESFNDNKSQAREGKMIWEGLSGQFYSAF